MTDVDPSSGTLLPAFLAQCSLAESGVTGDALLDGAAAGLSLSLPYCRYLTLTLSESVSAVTVMPRHWQPAGSFSSRSRGLPLELDDEDQPHQNHYTIYSKVWHATSLALLSNADIANLWRLADYFMADESASRCIEDVAVQRQARTGIRNQLLSDNYAVRVAARVAAVLKIESEASARSMAVVRGLISPPHPHNCLTAAKWGHWDLLRTAVSLGIPWDVTMSLGAAAGGQVCTLTSESARAVSFPCHSSVSALQVALLRRLKEAGCPFDAQALRHAVALCQPRAAAWLLAELGATVTYADMATDAARYGCLPVLHWAYDRGRLASAAEVAALRWRASSCGHSDVASWLECVSTAAQA
jgi:hypothetical protein